MIYSTTSKQSLERACHRASGSYPLATEEEVSDRKRYTYFLCTERHLSIRDCVTRNICLFIWLEC